MKAILKSNVISAFCFLSVLFYSLPSKGQTFNFRSIERDSLHTASYINTHGLNDTIVVSHDAWDDMVSNSSSWGNNLKFKSVHDFVRFSIDYGYTFKITDPYILRLTYKIYGFSNPASPNTVSTNLNGINDTLTIAYKPDSLAAFQDRQYKKYTGYHKIMIVLTGLYEIDDASGTPTPITLGPSSGFSWLNFNVEGAVVAQPYNKKVKYSSTYKEAYGTDGKLEIKPLTAANDNLPVYWQMYGTTLNAANVLPLNPVNYELEWTYVDNYAVDPSDGTSSSISTSNLKYNFADNATRVVLDTNYYKIPLIYQGGYVVYRVRMVRPDSVNFQYPIYGPWTITDNTGTISSLSGDYVYNVGAHIGDGLNWQYTVSFAEQGKYKHVMSYYDGMLKNRQSITRFNSQPNRLIATEQFYDFEGRPSISILPTPIIDTNFRYQPGLALNSLTDTPFRARDFDTIQLTSCPNEILLPPLSSASLANIYYSFDNPDKAGFQKFVPDAGGYPLVQTIYSPGYDERVEKQGGAGDTLQIGYKHNVKNDYTGTEQTDLNRLFGTNVGWTGYYRKTVSRDPNGQLSLNITDYKGKTMMSSMIGLPDTATHALVSNENLSDTVQYKEDFLAGMPQQTAGNQRILDKLFFNEAPGNNTSQYVYHFAPYQTFCSGKYLTVRAAYDYTIFDECGITVAHSDSILGQTGVLSSATADTFYETPPLGFYMEKGKHSLNKVLTINTDDVALAVDSFLSLPISENCLKDEPWFIKESVLSKQFPCPEKYIDLNCPSCGSKKYEMIKELYPNFDSSYVERKYGVYEIINGVVVGNNNSDFTLICGEGFDQSQWTTHIGANDLAGAGTEMSPYLGINNWPVAPVDTNGFTLPFGPYIVLTGGDTLHCKYRYQDTCVVKMPDTVIKYGNIYTSLQQIPVGDFINIFNDSIAEALLPMHPEYCKMLDCVDDDIFPRLLNKIPNAKIAEPLSLLYLSDLVNADPIFTVMSAHPGDFPNPFDFLGYITDGPQGPLCLDTIAFNEAYCRSTDANMLSQCQTDIYQGEIASGTLINDFVKDRYFKSLRRVYLANRKRYLYLLSPSYSGGLDCRICDSVRMTLVPEPVFPDNDSIGVSLLDDFISSMVNGSPQSPSVTSSSSALDLYFETVDGIDLSPFQSAADSALNIYITNSTLIIHATLDSMMAQFANCIQQGRLPQVRDYLQGFYDAGQVTNFTFTPEQVLEALNSQGITLDDLCNPYIVNYDGLAPQPEDDNTGMECGNIDYFTDMSEFLTNTALPAFQSPGYTNHISLPASNLFAQAIANVVGDTSCWITSSYNSTNNLYNITYTTYSALPVTISVKATTSDPFTAASGETVELIAGCYKEVFGNFPQGYVGNLSFALTAKHIPSSGPATVYRMKGWNDQVSINDLRENHISQCVPYAAFRELFTRFQDTMVTYNIKSLDHPYFSTMLKNFMNYSLHKVFTEGQYMDFLESSALGDSTILFRQQGYIYLNAYSYAYMTQFMTDINAVDSLINIIPIYRLRYPGYNSEEVAIDFRTIPKNRLRVFSDFVSDYVGSHPAYFNNWEINRNPDLYKIGILVVPSSSAFNPDSISFPSHDFSFNVIGATNSWNGNGYDSVKVYYVNANGSASDYDNSYNTWYLEKYLNDEGFAYKYYPTLFATVNDEYSTEEKQDYLHYTYGFQGLPSNTVLDTLQEMNLESLIPSFNGKLLSYSHPARPDNLQNLYIGDTATATDNTKYDKLEYIITKVKSHFNNLYSNSDNNILFAGSNTRLISMPSGEMLTAYRCKDTAFWYRYFGQGDTLYNVFLRVPAYIDTQYYNSYKLIDYGYNLGEGTSRSFWMQFQSDTAPIPQMIINGFTDFAVAKNKVLHDVLLTHQVNENGVDIDTVLNCEHSLLNTAIYEGKVKYKFYIDSIRNKLYGDFFAYIMDGGISEKLLVSYRNQRFNYTLYNYDRAGNLVLTVPPAGIAPLTSLQLPSVDPDRQASSNLIPDHKKVSIYKYNTLNQLFYQKTPDGGEVSFFYDAAGRVIFSQNDNQKPAGYMTYTLYDKQGRIVETGQAKIACNYFTPWQNATPTTLGPSCSYYDPINHLITPYPDIVTDLQHKTHEQITAYVHSLNREEVVFTTYDKASMELSPNPGFTNQENLRKRVADIKYFASWGTSDTAAEYYDYAMHFSYDIAGNVKTLVRDYPAYKSIHEQFKRVDYDYDVISGKVNMLSYNRGFPDQYYQKYAYDADNRITKVETSSDGIIWQRDASYQYYQHGPLARMEIGDLMVQGVDYAYTIQGWLKSINSDLLIPEKEMGKDGVNGSANEIYAADVAALSLDYFKGDYKPIGTDTVTHLGSLGKNMYNGNIPRATTSIIPFPDLKSQYTYDQLNRIVRADYAYMNRATADLTTTADYYSSYAYDPDGNLKKLVRNGNKAGNLQMDSLTYYYQNGTYSSTSVNDNKLVNITDWASDGSGSTDYPLDITHYTTVNSTRYQYDAVGNVIGDLVSGQGIKWNHYNKVESDYNSIQNHTLDFAYDGTGNRYIKSVTTSNGVDSTQTTSDYYVRDAQGNILAIYKDENSSVMSQQEWIEYFTHEFTQVPCDRFTYLSRYILPFYGAHSSFTNTMFDYALANAPTWVLGQVNDSAVSFYMNSSYNVLNNTISAISANTAAYPAMANWALANTTTGILTPALYEHTGFAANDASLMEPFLNHVFASTNYALDTVPNGVIGLLCNYAPDIMDTVMSDYGLTPTLSTCEQKSVALVQQANSSGLGGRDFFAEIYALRGQDATQYHSFFSRLYDAANIRFYDNASHSYLSFLEELCTYSDDGMEAIMNSLGFTFFDNCASNVLTLESWLQSDLYNNMESLNDIILTSKNIGHYSDVFDKVYAASATANNEAILPVVYKHFVTSMSPAFLDTLFHDLDVNYDSGDPDYSAGRLFDAFKNEPSGLVGYIAHNMYKDTSSVTFDTSGPVPVYSMYNFLDSLMADSVVMYNPYFTAYNHYNNNGNFSYLLHDLLLQVAEGKGSLGIANKSRADLMSFIDGWDQGRTMLERGSNMDALLAAVYNAAPAQFLDAYCNDAGNTDILTQSLMAINGLNLTRFVDNIYSVKIPPCTSIMVTDSIVHTAYVNARQSRRFSLASHILYGSSRLGTKDYLPGQFYKYYNAADSITDTASLGGWRPWYNLEVNDWIAGLVLEPYPFHSALDYSHYYATHVIGRKQYELNNHLGNVQATVTDLPYWSANGPDVGYITKKSAAIASAYDYYPFGMLMPDRYVSDTSSQCMTVTQTRWVTTWVDSCYQVAIPDLWTLHYFNGATLAYEPGLVVFDAQRIDASISMEGISVVPNAAQIITFDVDEVKSGSARIEVSETVGGERIILGSALSDHTSLVDIHFVPSGSSVTIDVIGQFERLAVRTICVKRPVPVEQTYLVDVCSGLKDRYRFGFNGQEKVNEWAGIGNHNTAEFWEYDTRTGRRLNLDPKPNPSWSNYAAFGNNPILNNDVLGDTLDVANNDESKNDIKSLVSDKNKDRVGFDGTRVTIDYEGLDEDGKNKLLASDEGLNLVNDLVSSESKFLYEATDVSLTRNESGEKQAGFTYSLPHGIINASENGKDSEGKHTSRPREGYQGQVIINPDVKFEETRGGTVIQKSRASIVFHELAENYERTNNNVNYNRGNGSIGAHRLAKRRENRWHGRSSSPGEPSNVILPSKPNSDRLKKGLEALKQYMNN